MGNYAKRLSRNSLCLLLKALCCDVANFLALKLAIDALGVSGYGTYAAVSGLVLLFSKLNSVMENSVCRFLGRALGDRDGGGYAAVFTTALGLVAALAVVVVVLGETVGLHYFRHFLVVPAELSAAAGVAFHAGIVMVVALTVRTVFSAVMSSCERMSALAAFGFAEGVLSLVSAALAFAFREHGIEVYALSLSASSVLLLLGFAAYCFRRVEGVRIVRGFRGAETREMGAFFLWSTLNGVGNVARNNEISSAPHMAVGIHGNDHVFELNVISNVCTSSDDAGALYKGRNPSCRGNVIRWNYWRDIGSPQGHGTAAIYFDDGDGGDHVVGNLFVNCGVPGKGSFGTIFSHGGYDNDVRNNIFVHCARPLGSSPWKQDRWMQCLQSEFWLKRLKEEVDITSEVYLKRYPELKGFMGPHPDAQRWNHASKNAFIDCPDISSGRWDVDKTNAKILADPGFKNVKTGDYSLKRTSRIYNQIKGFEQIPFERIGLLTKESERKVR